MSRSQLDRRGRYVARWDLDKTYLRTDFDTVRDLVRTAVENGELTYAVEEVTIAGKLADMLRNVTAIGNDLVFRGSVASPTLRIDGMTIAGA